MKRNEYNTPLWYVKEYPDVAKHFVKLKKRWHIGKQQCIYGDSYHKWPISFEAIGLGWKNKYDDWRFEWCPAYVLKIFNYEIRCTYHPQSCDDMLYWETFLVMAFDNKCIYDAVRINTWKRMDDGSIENAYTCGMLSDYGKKEYERQAADKSYGKPQVHTNL